jgi:hypothetical protein
LFLLRRGTSLRLADSVSTFSNYNLGVKDFGDFGVDEDEGVGDVCR